MHRRLQIQARRALYRLFNEQGSEEDFQITEKGPHEAGLYQDALCPAAGLGRLRALGKGLWPQVPKGEALTGRRNLRLCGLEVAAKHPGEFLVNLTTLDTQVFSQLVAVGGSDITRAGKCLC